MSGRRIHPVACIAIGAPAIGLPASPTKAPWFAAFQQELLLFPVGKHDDQVDALGLIGQMLATLMVGKEPVNKAKKFDPDKDAYRAFRNDRQLQAFFANADDIDGGEAQSWKTI